MAAVVASGGTITTLDLWAPSAPVPYWPTPPATSNAAGEKRRPPSPDVYYAIWRHQPAVRTVVSFLARNVAQVGLHVFRRLDDTDRVRLRAADHPAAAALLAPNPYTTQYRLLEALVTDLCVYDLAYLVKTAGGNGRLELRRISPRRTRVTTDALGRPTAFTWKGPAGEVTLDPADVVWCRGWCDLYADSVPPLETLRAVLEEDAAAVTARREGWQRGPRLSGWIERPMDAPAWEDTDAARFRAQFRAAYASGGSDAGGVPVLEDGMKLHDWQLTPEQAQYVEVRQLTRAEAAAAYHTPPTMVGLTEGATYSNTAEHHKMLYTDTLGPIFAMLEQDFALQVIAELDPAGQIYAEANIAEKLQGDFTEQATALTSAVGAPYMTRSEARARMNLPHLDDADPLVVPLNVLEGGQASPRDTVPKAVDDLAVLEAAVAVKAARPRATLEATAGLAAALEDVYRGWARTVAGTLGRAKADGPPPLDAIDGDRLAAPFAKAARKYSVAASSAGQRAVLARHAPTVDGWPPEHFEGWAEVTAERAAGGAVRNYLGALAAGVAAGTPWREALATVTDANIGRAEVTAAGITTPADNVGRNDGAELAGLASKVWVVTSANPRPSHATLDGEVVPMGANFSNGAAWPGDTAALPPDETAGCTCLLDFAKE